jgi:hypothetical protein
MTKNSDFCIFGSIHGNIFVFNSVSGVMLGSFRISTKPILFMEISPCGYYALVACGDNHVYLFEIQNMLTNMLKSSHSKKDLLLGELVSDVLRESVTQFQWKSTDEQAQVNEASGHDNYIFGKIDLLFLTP